MNEYNIRKNPIANHIVC